MWVNVYGVLSSQDGQSTWTLLLVLTLEELTTTTWCQNDQRKLDYFLALHYTLTSFHLSYEGRPCFHKLGTSHKNSSLIWTFVVLAYHGALLIPPTHFTSIAHDQASNLGGLHKISTWEIIHFFPFDFNFIHILMVFKNVFCWLPFN